MAGTERTPFGGTARQGSSAAAPLSSPMSSAAAPGPACRDVAPHSGTRPDPRCSSCSPNLAAEAGTHQQAADVAVRSCERADVGSGRFRPPGRCRNQGGEARPPLQSGCLQRLRKERGVPSSLPQEIERRARPASRLVAASVGT